MRLRTRIRLFLGAITLALGLTLAAFLTAPKPACADMLCGGNVPCYSSIVCIPGCACLGGTCTSVR